MYCHSDFPPEGWTIVRSDNCQYYIYYYAQQLATGYKGLPRPSYDEAFKDALEGAYGYPMGS